MFRFGSLCGVFGFGGLTGLDGVVDYASWLLL